MRTETSHPENKDSYLQEAGTTGLTHSETDKDRDALSQAKHSCSRNTQSAPSETDLPSPPTNSIPQCIAVGKMPSSDWTLFKQHTGGFIIQEVGAQASSSETMVVISYHVRRENVADRGNSPMLSVFLFSTLGNTILSSPSLKLLYFTSFFTSTGKPSHTHSFLLSRTRVSVTAKCITSVNHTSSCFQT